MRIGIFGGSFDPVHREHIALVRAAIDSLRLDKMLVMPAKKPPHKPWKRLSADADRLQMCRLAFAGIPEVEVSAYEIEQGGTSYTYLTCRHFKEKYPNSELFWLVGGDMLRDFPTWKEPEDILQNVTLAVCGRNEQDGWCVKEQEVFYQKFGKKFSTIAYNGADISSTKIRVMAGAGMDLTPYMPTSVAEYIEQNGLYYIEGAKEALALEKPDRRAHSVRVAQLAIARAVQLRLPESTAIQAALFHDCAKNLADDSPYLEGFSMPTEWGDVPRSVAHQFMGAYIAEKWFGIKDQDVLNAIRYHTSGRPKMSELEKLIFLSDMLEEERSYEGVDDLRKLFWKGHGLDECLEEALFQTLEFLNQKGAAVYKLTSLAYAFYKK